MTRDATAAAHAPRVSGWLGLAGAGAALGLTAGAFGIGGGIVTIPLLLFAVRLPQRVAAPTALLAALPGAAIALFGFAMSGHAHLIAGLILAGGSIVGAQLGGYLLVRTSERRLAILLAIFLTAVAVSLWVIVPQRGAEVALDPPSIAGLLASGLIAGIILGLFGIGAGVVAIPLSMFVTGMDDLTAKGTSLIMLIAGALSGTIAGILRRLTDVRAAIIMALFSVPFTPIGVALAHWMSPLASGILLSLFLLGTVAQLLLSKVRRKGALPSTLGGNHDGKTQA